MSSSFSTLQGSLLELLSEILDTLEQLHTASIKFTVKRENDYPIGLEINISCLLAEQKPKETDKTMWLCDNCGYSNFNHPVVCARCGAEKELTVSANC